MDEQYIDSREKQKIDKEKRMTSLLDSKNVKEQLIKRGIIDKSDNLVITYINDNLYFMSINTRENIRTFLNGNCEPIGNLEALQKSYFYYRGQILAGYIEKENKRFFKIEKINGISYPQGLLIITKKVFDDLDIETGKEIQPFTQQYFNTTKDISFFNGRLGIECLKQDPLPGEKQVPIDSNFIGSSFKTGDMRINDLEFFWKRKDFSDEIFWKFVKEFSTLLLVQIADERFIKVGDPVTKEELDGYLEKGYISQDLYITALELMVELGKLDQEIVNIVKQQIKPELKGLQQEIK